MHITKLQNFEAVYRSLIILKPSHIFNTLRACQGSQGPMRSNEDFSLVKETFPTFSNRMVFTRKFKVFFHILNVAREIISLELCTLFHTSHFGYRQTARAIQHPSSYGLSIHIVKDDSIQFISKRMEKFTFCRSSCYEELMGLARRNKCVGSDWKLCYNFLKCNPRSKNSE